ncbi:MAG: acetyl-CoA carboxylase biotin carboxyl carrier protein subunit, partial [Acidimicrobiia bacterium]
MGGDGGRRLVEEARPASVPVEVRSPLQGTVVAVSAEAGAGVEPGTELAVIESMKVEHPVLAGVAGTVVAIHVAAGAVVEEGTLVASVEEVTAGVGQGPHATAEPGCRG